MWPASPEPRLHVSRTSGFRSARPTVSFYVLPNSVSPRMLVPANNPTAAARSMQRFSAALSAPDTAKRLAVSALLRSHSAAMFPHRMEVQESAGSFREWLTDLFGEHVDFSLALGTARVNRKPVLQVFDRRGRSLAFVKLGPTAVAAAHVSAEAEALKVLGVSGPISGIHVPTILHAGHWQDSVVLVMSALETSRWQNPSRQWTVPHRAMRSLHGHFAGPPQTFATMPFRKSMTVAVESLPSSPAQDRLGVALQRLDALAGDLELIPGAWHGDWTPWNMARRRGRLQLWDWERFELGVPGGLDRCHYGVNAVCRRDGVSPGSVLAGLRLAE